MKAPILVPISGLFCLKFLFGIKATFNTLFIIAFIGGLLGTGIVFGYAVSLFDKVSVPQTEDLIKQVNNISSISEIHYADGSLDCFYRK